MRVRNAHARHFAASADAVGRLVDGLSSADDRLWPRDRWPAMRFDRPLGVGTVGGHGPIRYGVESYVPGRLLRCRFTAPRGVRGTHQYEVEALAGGGAVLRHEMTIDTSGLALLSWPLVFRPMHDALIEDSLDRAAVALGEAPVGAPWSPVVRLLRAAGRIVRARARR
jgi:hypothetical protein